MPGLSDIFHFSSQDGFAVALLLALWAVGARHFAGRDWKAGNRKGFVVGVRIALGFGAAALAVYAASDAWAPHDGPGLWAAAAVVLALISLVNYAVWHKTGKPLV